jgi:cAMP-dependent protein kinase regulator
MTTRAEREEANRRFLKSKVDVHLNKLIIELLKRKPDNVLDFIKTWSTEELKKGGANADGNADNNAFTVNSDALNTETIDMKNVPKEDKGTWEAPEVDSDEGEEDDGEVPDLDANLAKNKPKAVNRISVSAEVYGVNNQKKEYVPKVVEKSEEAKARISSRLDQAFMFASLDGNEKQIVLNAMEEHTFKKGDTVIKQGDDGDVLFCVDSGTLKCYRRMKKDDAEDTFLKDYVPGDAFGELALLYNAPRAATIIADEDSVCFS